MIGTERSLNFKHRLDHVTVQEKRNVEGWMHNIRLIKFDKREKKSKYKLSSKYIA
jgi:hypothetical protein